MVGRGGDDFTTVVREPRLERAVFKSGLVIIWSSIKFRPTFIFLNNHNLDLHRPIEKALPRSANTPSPHPLRTARSLLGYENDTQKTR